MASLYRPTIIRYQLPGSADCLPDGTRVNKNTPGAVKVKDKSPTWWGKWKDRHGNKHCKPLSERKGEAREMLLELERNARRAGAGIDVNAEANQGKPLEEHLEDYKRTVASRDNCEEHVLKTCSQCKAILDGCGFKTLDDLAEGPVEEFLASLRRPAELPKLDPRKERYTVAEVAALCGITRESIRRMTVRGQFPGEGKGHQRWHSAEAVRELLERRARGIGPEMSNHYLRSIKSFTRWLVRNKRLTADPLTGLTALNPDVDLRHVRRALDAKEFLDLIEATRPGKTFRNLTGADRVALYCLAGNTGLRAGELASLSPASFDLDADTPTVTVQAGYSKRRRKDPQPLREDMVAMLREYLAGKERDALLWPGTWEGCAAEMLRIDLSAAGIPYRDDGDKVSDFHALRHGFISCLALGGVHPKVAQQLARHSTITLTMDRYTHLGIVDAAEGLKALPPLPGATGNEGKAGKNRKPA